MSILNRTYGSSGFDCVLNIKKFSGDLAGGHGNRSCLLEAPNGHVVRISTRSPAGVKHDVDFETGLKRSDGRECDGFLRKQTGQHEFSSISGQNSIPKEWILPCIPSIRRANDR